MRRSFGGGFKSNNNTSNFSRNDRRDDRNDNNRERNRFNSNNDHRKPLNRVRKGEIYRNLKSTKFIQQIFRVLIAEIHHQITKSNDVTLTIREILIR